MDPISKEDLTKILEGFPNSKAAGPSGLSYDIQTPGRGRFKIQHIDHHKYSH
jgi:hypothetical protein